MSFIIIATSDTSVEAIEIKRIATVAKIGCAFRDLTKDKEGKVTFDI